MSAELSLQERFAPQNRCFGCGQANPQGLRIRSYPEQPADGDLEVVCRWQPQPHHLAFPGVLNGGIIGTLLDCHSNWTAIWHWISRDGLRAAPASVTADFHVRMRRPTPIDRLLEIRGRVVASEGNRAEVEASLSADGQVTATCVGHFVAVGPDHPAYDRW